jgi:hypothetical protein
MKLDATTILHRLKSLADLTDIQIAGQEIVIEIHDAPHTPPRSLPTGKIAVYAFFFQGKCLKVAKVGPKSAARYTRQHYDSQSAKSNLAKSILKSPKSIGIGPVEPVRVGEWIKDHTDRINILFPKEWGIPFLTLVEAFLQFWLQPVYEGFESQKDSQQGAC